MIKNILILLSLFSCSQTAYLSQYTIKGSKILFLSSTQIQRSFKRKLSFNEVFGCKDLQEVKLDHKPYLLLKVSKSSEIRTNPSGSCSIYIGEKETLQYLRDPHGHAERKEFKDNIKFLNLRSYLSI